MSSQKGPKLEHFLRGHTGFFGLVHSKQVSKDESILAIGFDLVNLKNTEKLIGKKIPVVKDHPFHPEKLVEQKRDSNNKPFVPKPKPQKKEDINFKKPKKKVFYRKK